MKRLYETFTDEEFKAMTMRKGERTWRQYILDGGSNGGDASCPFCGSHVQGEQLRETIESFMYEYPDTATFFNGKSIGGSDSP
jgi:hypothetical protein